MSLTIDFTPQTEAWIWFEANRQGLPPIELVRNVLDELAATRPSIAWDHPHVEQDPTIALLQSWLDEDATDDPEEIRKAEEELAEFKRNMNAPRKEAGERLLFPEVECP